MRRRPTQDFVLGQALSSASRNDALADERRHRPRNRILTAQSFANPPCTLHHNFLARVAKSIAEMLRGQPPSEHRRRADAQQRDAPGPIELIRQVGNDDLGHTRPGRSGSGTRATVVYHCRTAGKQPCVADGGERHHTFGQRAFRKTRPALRHQRAATKLGHATE